MYEIIRLTFDSSKPAITFETSWIVVVAIILLVGIGVYKFIKIFKRDFEKHDLEIEISGEPKLIFKVDRNNENLYIANRIHIELTTRKAAIPIDENNDVIEEIYDSWYKLFGIIRDEIKTVPGKYLKDHDPTSALIGLTRKILNDGLRPHLTEHQAKYRAWLSIAKEDANNRNLSPQQLQKKYPDFDNLVSSMKDVNLLLIKYAHELDKLIKGK